MWAGAAGEPGDWGQQGAAEGFVGTYGGGGGAGGIPPGDGGGGIGVAVGEDAYGGHVGDGRREGVDVAAGSHVDYAVDGMEVGSEVAVVTARFEDQLGQALDGVRRMLGEVSP